MSTYHYVIINAALALPTAQAEERMRATLERMRCSPGRWEEPTLLADGIAFVMEPGQLPHDGIAFEAGRIRANLLLSNFGDGMEDPSTGGKRSDAFLKTLGGIVAARTGDIVGAIRSEDDHVGSPITMTERGLAIIWTTAADPRRGYGPEDEETLVSLPADAISFRAGHDGIDEAVVDVDRVRSAIAGTTFGVAASR